MKRIICCALLAALLLTATGCGREDQAEVHQPPNALIAREQEAGMDNTTPSGAVAGLLDAVILWDMGVAAQFTGTVDPEEFSAYQAVLLPFIERMEYQLGAERIDGGTAMVDVYITAVDAGGALNDMTFAAAAYALTESLSGGEIDLQAFLTEYLRESLDVQALTRTKRQATVHLKQDNMGRWRLDTSNPDNMGFYDALSGGALQTVLDLKDLAEQYNVLWR